MTMTTTADFLVYSKKYFFDILQDVSDGGEALASIIFKMTFYSPEEELSPNLNLFK